MERENVLDDEPTHAILCSKVIDGSILPTIKAGRELAVF